MKESIKNYYLDKANGLHYKGIGRLGRNQIHKIIEKPFNKDTYSQKIIELGALFGNHRKFLKQAYKEYWETDLLITETEQFKGLNDELNIRKHLDASNLSEIPSNEFDRLIATCLIAHLNNPEEALKEWRRVVKKDGYLSIWVQLEPSLFLRVIQFLISRKNDEFFYEVHFNEHINYFTRMEYFINKTFKNDYVKRRMFPFPFLTWNFNGTAIYTIKKIN